MVDLEASFTNSRWKRRGRTGADFAQAVPSAWNSLHAVTKSCPTLGDSVDCSLPGSSVHGIL